MSPTRIVANPTAKFIGGYRVPMRYLPNSLTRKDKKKQMQMLLKSKQQYKSNRYYTRGKVASYKNRKSNHIATARKIYGVETITPNQELARKTGCTISALQKIVKKGEGAYYSSGSRPNQTPQSWGLARLASSLTAGKSAAVDYDILKNGCNHTKKSFILANKSKRKYGFGQSSAKKTNIP